MKMKKKTSCIIVVRFGRLLYIAFSVLYLSKGFRGRGRGTTSFFKTFMMAYVQIYDIQPDDFKKNTVYDYYGCNSLVYKV